MTTSTQEVVSLYESGSLNIEEISTELGLDIASVKAVLLQYSSKYKQQLADKTASEESCQISSGELKVMFEAYKTIALCSEVDAVRERALKNLINHGLKVNDGIGENDVRKLMQKSNINLTLIQQNILKARESLARSREKALKNKRSPTNPILELEVVNG